MDELIRVCNFIFDDAVITSNIYHGENTTIIYVFDYQLKWNDIKILEDKFMPVEDIKYFAGNDSLFNKDAFVIRFKMYHMPVA